MDECDIFREQLAIAFPSKGHALWDPHPKIPNQPVEVGDVGFIRMGQFHRLFNILRSSDEQSGTRLPEHYERFVPKSPDHIAHGILTRGHYCSAGISVDYRSGIHASSPDDFQEVSFRYCRKREGAVLFLPVNARREDTLSQSDFGQWMVKHIDDWFSFAQSLGNYIEQMKDIILVTGGHYTRSWGNIAFLGNQANSEATFGFRVNDNPNKNIVSIMWQSSIVHSPGAVLLQGPQGMNLPEDQCVFVRGFRVARTLRILPKHLKAAAGPSPGPEEDGCEPGVELVLIPPVAKYRDPLHQIIDYISERTPDCDMVLVHDDDLARVDGIGDGILRENLQHGAVTDLLQNSDKQIHMVSCNLSPVSSSPNTNTDPAVIKVAMLSTELQNRSSASVTASANMGAEARSLPKGYAVIDSQSQDRKSDHHETRRTPIVLPLQNASRPAERRSLSGLPYHLSVPEDVNWAPADNGGNIDEGHPLTPSTGQSQQGQSQGHNNNNLHGSSRPPERSSQQRHNQVMSKSSYNYPWNAYPPATNSTPTITYPPPIPPQQYGPPVPPISLYPTRGVVTPASVSHGPASLQRPPISSTVPTASNLIGSVSSYGRYRAHRFPPPPPKASSPAEERPLAGLGYHPSAPENLTWSTLRSYRNSPPLPPRPIATVDGPKNCIYAGCLYPAYYNHADQEQTEYCGLGHEMDAISTGLVDTCVMCTRRPRLTGERVCGRTCRERLEARQAHPAQGSYYGVQVARYRDPEA